MSQARALSIEASKSLASRRFRLSQAMVRSATQRRLMRWKPGVAWTRLTISIVHLPPFECGLEFVTGVAGIGEDMAQPGKGIADAGDEQPPPIPILAPSLIPNRPNQH